ncbi:hypothetical protein MPNT_430004 [Candidatus Methylacidithermus pantelleriae]|uniref:Uncharacterized protein n=1 Tax=Candidatus Methylacidithermus pantelleriae TaxID=2744239 RepID=A0A8J2BRK6_9BACT|nr:hypothetical protein MPNT_430004 [Candidatus Methylacidithermus pantelleriae]
MKLAMDKEDPKDPEPRFKLGVRYFTEKLLSFSGTSRMASNQFDVATSLSSYFSIIKASSKTLPCQDRFAEKESLFEREKFWPNNSKEPAIFCSDPYKGYESKEPTKPLLTKADTTEHNRSLNMKGR